MNRHANLQVVALAVALVAAAPAARGQDHQMITPGDLKWADQPSLPPGAQIAVIEGKTPEESYTFRLRFPANYKIPAHWHPTVERVTVISGTFHMGIGDKLDPAKTMALGSACAAWCSTCRHVSLVKGQARVVASFPASRRRRVPNSMRLRS